MFAGLPHRVILLLAVGLLAVPALAVAHAFDHPLLDHADRECVVCVHGQGLDALLPVTVATPAVVPAATPTPTLAWPAPAPAAPPTYRSRAPPIVLPSF